MRPPEPLRLPREVEADPGHDDVRRALAARTTKLWSGGTLEVACIPLTDALRAALGKRAIAAVLQRGLETATATLVAEARGLAALPEEAKSRQGSRVSRVLFVTNDGAERFYRQVERLVVTHAPRVLVCRLECDAATLGSLLYGGDALVKSVLTGHKSAAASLLLALRGS